MGGQLATTLMVRTTAHVMEGSQEMVSVAWVSHFHCTSIHFFDTV